ncbi:MAG TPA: hypothetical protein VKJ01_09680 [Candidatus Solibacter sp.]|nr:hypothetical protein [Candidatus Solibacter sp.]
MTPFPAPENPKPVPIRHRQRRIFRRAARPSAELSFRRQHAFGLADRAIDPAEQHRGQFLIHLPARAPATARLIAFPALLHHGLT